MRIRKLDGNYAVARLSAGAGIPDWATRGEAARGGIAGSFLSITRTEDELSIVVEESLVPTEVAAERGWSLLMVEGPLEFSEVGVLASLAEPLAEAEVSLFAVSTYDTDYLMVRKVDVDRAVSVLELSGHQILNASAVASPEG
jgi:hypothetical protein